MVMERDGKEENRWESALPVMNYYYKTASGSSAGHQSLTVGGHQNIMCIFAMECFKMCVVVSLALTAALGQSAAAASSPTGTYVYHQHKRSPVDPNLDLSSALTTGFAGFGPSSTLPDFGYGSGFSASGAGFGFNDATEGFSASAALLHLSHPYTDTAFGSGFDSIGYPFSESTLNQLQFKTALASDSSPSIPVSTKYRPAVTNDGLHHSHITVIPANEPVKPTAQGAVPLQPTRPNEQRIPVESINAATVAPALLQQSPSVPQQQTYGVYAPLQQSYPSSEYVPQRQSYYPSKSVPQQQSYPAVASVVPLQQSYPATVSIPPQQSYVTTISAPQKQSYPATISAPLQQSILAPTYVPQQQSYPAVITVPLQQSYPAIKFVPQQQSYSSSGSAPQKQSYSPSGSVPQQQSYSPSGSAPQKQSYSPSGSVPQQQSYSPSESVPQQQSYSPSGYVPQKQSYSPSTSVPQQQSYSLSGSTPLQQSYPSIESVPQQQSYQAPISASSQQSYVAAASATPQQSYPAIAEDFRISAFQTPTASSLAGSLFASEAGSVSDLILELRPPPYSAPASSVDYRQNVDIPSPTASLYPPTDNNNKNKNYPSNEIGLSSAPVAGSSGSNQVSIVSNGGPPLGNTNDFLAAGLNAKPDQTKVNTYYTVPIPGSGGSNSASNDVPNYYSIPSISYSLTSTANSEFAGTTNGSPAVSVTSIGTDRGVPAANPKGGPNLSYHDANSIPSVSFTSSNSISANSYSDSNSIQSSSYNAIPGSPIAGNSYSGYKLSTDNFYGESNSISPNSKRESSTDKPRIV